MPARAWTRGSTRPCDGIRQSGQRGRGGRTRDAERAVVEGMTCEWAIRPTTSSTSGTGAGGSAAMT